MGKKQKKRVFAEFSKKVIGALTAVWFIGAAVGIVIVTIQAVRGDMVSLGELLVYIDAPMTGGIVGYFIKSAQENREKIKVNGDDFINNDGNYDGNPF